MTTYIVMTLYLIGFVLSVRPALRRRMLRKVCSYCLRGTYHTSCKDKPKEIRGAVGDRDGLDAFVAIVVASWWLIRLLVLWFTFLLRSIGKGIGVLVLGGKLTMPEMQRHERERTAEIEQLSNAAGVEAIHGVVVPDDRIVHKYAHGFVYDDEYRYIPTTRHSRRT